MCSLVRDSGEAGEDVMTCLQGDIYGPQVVCESLKTDSSSRFIPDVSISITDHRHQQEAR